MRAPAQVWVCGVAVVCFFGAKHDIIRMGSPWLRHREDAKNSSVRGDPIQPDTMRPQHRSYARYRGTDIRMLPLGGQRPTAATLHNHCFMCFVGAEAPSFRFVLRYGAQRFTELIFFGNWGTHT